MNTSLLRAGFQTQQFLSVNIIFTQIMTSKKYILYYLIFKSNRVLYAFRWITNINLQVIVDVLYITVYYDSVFGKHIVWRSPRVITILWTISTYLYYDLFFIKL